jgi:hypothetical protein
VAKFENPAANWNQCSPRLLLSIDSQQKTPPAIIYINNFRRKVNLNPAGNGFRAVDHWKRRSERSSIPRQARQIIFDLLGAEVIRIQIDKTRQGRSRFFQIFFLQLCVRFILLSSQADLQKAELI